MVRRDAGRAIPRFAQPPIALRMHNRHRLVSPHLSSETIASVRSAPSIINELWWPQPQRMARPPRVQICCSSPRPVRGPMTPSNLAGRGGLPFCCTIRPLSESRSPHPTSRVRIDRAMGDRARLKTEQAVRSSIFRARTNLAGLNRPCGVEGRPWTLLRIMDPSLRAEHSALVGIRGSERTRPSPNARPIATPLYSRADHANAASFTAIAPVFFFDVEARSSACFQIEHHLADVQTKKNKNQSRPMHSRYQVPRGAVLREDARSGRGGGSCSGRGSSSRLRAGANPSRTETGFPWPSIIEHHDVRPCAQISPQTKPAGRRGPIHSPQSAPVALDYAPGKNRARAHQFEFDFEPAPP